jgi:hypothetical protein
MSDKFPVPSVFLPPPPERYSQEWMAKHSSSTEQNIAGRIQRGVAEAEFLLIATSGKTYRITVDDSGASPVIVATLYTR